MSALAVSIRVVRLRDEANPPNESPRAQIEGRSRVGLNRQSNYVMHLFEKGLIDREPETLGQAGLDIEWADRSDCHALREALGRGQAVRT